MPEGLWGEFVEMREAWSILKVRCCVCGFAGLLAQGELKLQPPVALLSWLTHIIRIPFDHIHREPLTANWLAKACPLF